MSESEKERIEIENRKRAKLRPGQRVAYAGETVELVAGQAS